MVTIQALIEQVRRSESGATRVVTEHALAALALRGGLRTAAEVRAASDAELLARTPGLGAWHLKFVRELLLKEAAC